MSYIGRRLNGRSAAEGAAGVGRRALASAGAWMRRVAALGLTGLGLAVASQTVHASQVYTWFTLASGELPGAYGLLQISDAAFQSGHISVHWIGASCFLQTNQPGLPCPLAGSGIERFVFGVTGAPGQIDISLLEGSPIPYGPQMAWLDAELDVSFNRALVGSLSASTGETALSLSGNYPRWHLNSYQSDAGPPQCNTRACSGLAGAWMPASVPTTNATVPVGSSLSLVLVGAGAGLTAFGLIRRRQACRIFRAKPLAV